jgi:N-formylglutamate deformylase
MYHRKLRVEEVRKRIALYYEPYHEALRMLLDTAAEQFGAVWHINCHSMKSTGNAMNVDNGSARPDIVVSDNDGSTADPGFTWLVADCWRSMGYTVSINAPYKGGEIVKRYGRPQANRHSIQIEINRQLYMNESTFVQTEGFRALQAHTEDFLRMLRNHVKACTG